MPQPPKLSLGTFGGVIVKGGCTRYPVSDLGDGGPEACQQDVSVMYAVLVGQTNVGKGRANQCGLLR
jgi:hypothetical protein